jgi:hypothetical protein
MAQSEKTLLSRLAKLGLSNFETVEEARRRQAEILRRLERAGIDQGYYVGLDDCGPDRCGRVNCAAACWFGRRQRWLREIQAAYRLFQQYQGPLYEVRIIRESWQRPVGKLNTDSIAAAKQLNRRRLDTLYSPTVVAVGTYKVSIAPRHVGDHWMNEIHEIVAGVDKTDLERIFSGRPTLRGFSSNIFWAKPVTDLSPTITDVLRQDLPIWQQPYTKETGPRADKAERGEFYTWLLRLSPDERLIRYGCDKYFNRLAKKPRIYRAKVKKKRPHPYWLFPYQYGEHYGCDCNICQKRKG